MTSALNPEVIYTAAAPKTGFSEGTESPIAQGVKCGGFVFVSGQGPLDPVTKQVVSEDIAEQTRVTLDNVRLVLEAAGSSLRHVVKVGVFLRNMEDFPVFNRVFKDYFAGVQPARTTVEAAPPRKGVNVEIDAIGYIP
jgi:2-iminobutanoate/2-iminopropanoate deaminase